MSKKDKSLEQVIRSFEYIQNANKMFLNESTEYKEVSGAPYILCLRYGNKYASPFLVNLSGLSQVNKTVLRKNELVQGRI